jgi:3-methyladenine DNA glycosylase/8-oxoguanine DNA glycosylase
VVCCVKKRALTTITLVPLPEGQYESQGHHQRRGFNHVQSRTVHEENKAKKRKIKALPFEWGKCQDNVNQIRKKKSQKYDPEINEKIYIEIVSGVVRAFLEIMLSGADASDAAARYEHETGG